MYSCLAFAALPITIAALTPHIDPPPPNVTPNLGSSLKILVAIKNIEKKVIIVIIQDCMIKVNSRVIPLSEYNIYFDIKFCSKDILNHLGVWNIFLIKSPITIELLAVFLIARFWQIREY
ncbi:hypothetical protein CLC19171_1310 [Campylobacter lari subsp. concheus]